MPLQPTYTELIDAYIQGKLSPEDEQKLMESVARGDADKALEERFTTDWLNAGEFLSGTQRLSSQDSANLLQVINDQIDQAGPSLNEKAIAHKPVPILVKKWWKVAAVIITLLGIAFLWKHTIGTHYNTSAESQLMAGYNKIVNSNSALQQVVLQDGSLVVLAPGAELRYPNNLADLPERTVLLDGDAFFEIAHQNGKKFIVRGNALSTEVLGTSFWVRQNSKEQKHEVEVRSGKVKVTLLNQPAATAPEGIIVLPNQQVSLQKGSKQFVKALANDLLPLAVTQAEQADNEASAFALNYTRPTPLKEVINDLEVMYGVTVEVKDKQMLQTLMSGNLTHIKLQNKLEVICLSIGAAYTIEADKIVLHN